MLHSKFPAASSNETIAAYFLYGLGSGLFPEDCAKDWAFGVIEALDAPPIEIIDVATANHRDDIFRALASASVGGDSILAGRWLLAHIRNELDANRLPLRSALRAAMHVSTSAGLPENVFYTFDGLDDGLYLAEHGSYGTVDDVLKDTLVELTSHAESPLSAT